MTVAIAPPFIHIEDSNGNPYVGGKLFVYEYNTTTLASIYSDTSLSISITNPLTSDAAGNFDRAYISAGQYKLRAETSAAVLIWEWDYIDTGLGNAGGPLPIASGGTAATSAAAARTALGAAAQTDVDNLTTDFAALSASFQTIVSAPQGRLTPTTAVPVITTGVTAGTSLFYTPFLGNQCPIWDGTQFNFKVFAELTLTLAASHVASAIYDAFLFLDSSTVTIGTGPAWNTPTNLLGDRGTGAGTTELQRKNGLWTNKVSMTARNGATTYTVDANKGTFVGSIFMDGTNGQISCLMVAGTARKWSISNAYNRMPVELQEQDATASWTYNSATIRQSRAQAADKLTVFNCLPEEIVDIDFTQACGVAANANTGHINIGVGWGVTNAYSGKIGTFYFTNASAVADETRGDLVAHYSAPPFIGIVDVASCESTPTATGTCTLYGTSSMLMTARWRA